MAAPHPETTQARRTRTRGGEQDIPDEEPAAVIEPEPADESGGDGPNNSEAGRQAIRAGYEKPGPAVAWIKETFGIEMNPTHFSAIKSNYLKKQATAPVAEPAKRGPKPKAAAPAASAPSRSRRPRNPRMTASPT